MVAVPEVWQTRPRVLRFDQAAIGPHYVDLGVATEVGSFGPAVDPHARDACRRFCQRTGLALFRALRRHPRTYRLVSTTVLPLADYRRLRRMRSPGRLAK